LGHPRLVIYRIHNGDFSTKNNGSNQSLVGFTEALNAGRYCLAYQNWLAIGNGETESISSIPFIPDSDCAIRGTNLATLSGLQERSSVEGYLSFRLVDDPTEGVVLTMRQRTVPVYDQRTSSVSLLLEPSSVYLYWIELKSSSPTAVLYWKHQDQEDYLEMNIFEDWSKRAILISTPAWEQAEWVSFSPVLFDHMEPVSLREFYIGKVELINEQ
jgi:hypothetical protein